MMFLRFVAGNDDEPIYKLSGIVTEARILIDAGVLETYQIDTIKNTFEYLNTHLPCPPFAESNWSNDAISWYKDSAFEFISRMWDLVAILKDCGRNVRVIKTEDPGRILYEDEFQIVAQNRLY